MWCVREMAVRENAQRLLFDSFQAARQNVVRSALRQPLYSSFYRPIQSGRLRPISQRAVIRGLYRRYQYVPTATRLDNETLSFNASGPKSVPGLQWNQRCQMFMTSITGRLTALVATAIILLLQSDDAWALRCGSRLVKEGMHESEVILICGEPESVRRLGYVLRPVVVKRPAGIAGFRTTKRVYGGFHQELAVTEMLYNFGPNRLMRVLTFEGGLLTSIDTAGYGHRRKRR